MSTETPSSTGHKTHRNDERTVRCPVDQQTEHECAEEPLARGVYLHVLNSSGGGHGPKGEVPAGLNFDDLETIGTREVSMDYPEHRETDSTSRLCPECGVPFEGKHGVRIHLGRMAGKQNHPENPHDLYDVDDYPIAEVDEDGNITNVVRKGIGITRDRDADTEDIDSILSQLDDDGLEEVRERAAAMLSAD